MAIPAVAGAPGAGSLGIPELESSAHHDAFELSSGGVHPSAYPVPGRVSGLQFYADGNNVLQYVYMLFESCFMLEISSSVVLASALRSFAQLCGSASFWQVETGWIHGRARPR